jgi:hypothetical protein
MHRIRQGRRCFWPQQKRNDAVVRLLLETGKIDLESKDVTGQTLLSCAVEGESVLAEGVKIDYKYSEVCTSL